MSRSVRGAFSVMELVVVIAIIVLILCLALPAIQKVREASNRLKCANNLQRIGNAFLTHHKTHGYFPRGGTSLPPDYPSSADITATTPASRETSWSWAYQILPFLDCEELFRNPDPAVVRQTPIPSYYCPSRRQAEAIFGTAKIDYAGNAGDQAEGQNGVVMRSIHGVVRIADLSHGASTIVLVAEKQLNRAMLGLSLDDNESYCTSGWAGDWRVYRWGASPPAPDCDLPGNTDPSYAFGSAHPAGFYCVFADGSVRFIRYSIAPPAWRGACVRDDNQGFNPNNLN